jgi:hypothetical protein
MLIEYYRWIEKVIAEEVANIEHFEQSLRNGVTLAKLVRVFEPTLVRRIFEVGSK